MIMGGSIESTFWRMAAAVVQHAAEREFFVAGEIAAANGPNKLDVRGRNVRFGSLADIAGSLSNVC
jgi:hypothetical protein